MVSSVKERYPLLVEHINEGDRKAQPRKYQELSKQDLIWSGTPVRGIRMCKVLRQEEAKF